MRTQTNMAFDDLPSVPVKARFKRGAVLGNSINSDNNGAGLVTWVNRLEAMMRAGGMPDLVLDNFSIPGQTWATNHLAQPTFDNRTNALYGGEMTSVDALKIQHAIKPYERIFVCDGFNDRANPNAIADHAAFRASLPEDVEVLYVGQHCLLDNGKVSSKGAATQAEGEAIEAVYATAEDPFYGASLAKLYEMGFGDEASGIHLINTGKQWYAAGIYEALQEDYALTPHTRNAAWLYSMYLTNRTVFDNMIRINT